MSRLLATALLAAVGCTAAHAQITLYEHRDFRGERRTLRDDAPDFSRIGFNDRASSVVVERGHWELCEHPRGGGFCQLFERGEYPRLDRRLDKGITSARQLDGPRGGPSRRGRDDARGSIRLYGQPNFRGRDIELRDDAADLFGQRFDDRASSAIVESGVWEVCRDPDFRGACRRLEPGRYPDLGRGMANEVSSVRLVGPEGPRRRR